jgi:hypothetical protein
MKEDDMLTRIAALIVACTLIGPAHADNVCEPGCCPHAFCVVGLTTGAISGYDSGDQAILAAKAFRSEGVSVRVLSPTQMLWPPNGLNFISIACRSGSESDIIVSTGCEGPHGHCEAVGQRMLARLAPERRRQCTLDVGEAD